MGRKQCHFPFEIRLAAVAFGAIISFKAAVPSERSWRIKVGMFDVFLVDFIY